MLSIKQNQEIREKLAKISQQLRAIAVIRKEIYKLPVEFAVKSNIDYQLGLAEEKTANNILNISIDVQNMLHPETYFHPEIGECIREVPKLS